MARHAKRLAQGEHGVAVVKRDGLTHELVGGPGVKLEITGDGGHIATRQGGGLAAVTRLDGSELVDVCQHVLRQALQQAATLGGGELAPGTVERLAGGVHGPVDVDSVAPRNGVKLLSGGRVDDGNVLARGRGDVLVGDVVQFHGLQGLSSLASACDAL